MAKLTNGQYWDILRDKFPAFRESTSKATLDMFTERGFEAIKNMDGGRILNDFFKLSLQVTLGKIDVAKVKDKLSESGFGEEVLNPNGGYIQRIAIEQVNQISPGYLNLVNGQSVDPFIVRKPTTIERFFTQNAEFQNLITIPDSVMMKNMFVSDNGMDDYISGMMAQLEASYRKFLYFLKLEAISAGINSTDFPLKDSQKIPVEYAGDDTTIDQLATFVLKIKNIISLMDASPSTGAFNQRGFESSQDVNRLKLLVRVGFRNLVSVKLRSNTYNPDNMNLPVDIIEVNNFGGLQAFKDKAYTIPLFEVYDKAGAEIGYNTVANSTKVTVENKDVFWKDPNEGVVAILADKDLVFTGQQGNYSVEGIRNPYGLYTNFFASAPRGTVAYDSLYNVVVFEIGDTSKG